MEGENRLRKTTRTKPLTAENKNDEKYYDQPLPEPTQNYEAPPTLENLATGPVGVSKWVKGQF